MYMSSTELQGLASYSQGLGGRPGFHVLPLDVLDEQTIVSAASQTSKLGSGQVGFFGCPGKIQNLSINTCVHGRLMYLYAIYLYDHGYSAYAASHRQCFDD